MGLDDCAPPALAGGQRRRGSRRSGRAGRRAGFVRALASGPIDRIAIENPVSVIGRASANPDRSFSLGSSGTETRPPCLAEGLPKLTATNIVGAGSAYPSHGTLGLTGRGTQP